MVGPETIFIDERVADRMPGLPDPNDEKVEVQYFRWDVVQSMVRQAGGPPEFVVQLLSDETGYIALTNYGRMFATRWDPISGKTTWEIFEGPDIEPPADPEP